MILALVLSVGIGVSLGLLGGGGSILTLPILVYALGMEAKQAIATSLLVVGVTSAAAMVPHARAGRVNARIGLVFGASSMAGAFAGGRLAHFLPSGALLVSFAIMMLVTGLAMLRGRAASAALVGRRPWGRILFVGVGIGLLTGVIGAGGGFVIVPALALLCGLSMPEAIATSLLVIALNSLSGFAGSIGHVTLDFRVAALVTTASVVGSVPGAFAAGRVPETALRRAFAWLVLVMAAFMLWRQTSALWGVAGLFAAIIGAWFARRRTVPALEECGTRSGNPAQRRSAPTGRRSLMITTAMTTASFPAQVQKRRTASSSSTSGIASRTRSTRIFTAFSVVPRSVAVVATLNPSSFMRTKVVIGRQARIQLRSARRRRRNALNRARVDVRLGREWPSW